MRFLFTLLAPALAIAVSAPVSAENVSSPFCKRDLSPVSNTLSQTRTALNVLAKMTGEERCEGYRRQLFPVVAARGVLAACNTSFDRDKDTSFDRDKEVTQFDQVIEQVNSGIADSCR
jgi:hypothetical protein